MDCYDAMIRRHRLFREGKINLSSMSQDHHEEVESRNRDHWAYQEQMRRDSFLKRGKIRKEKK